MFSRMQTRRVPRPPANGCANSTPRLCSVPPSTVILVSDSAYSTDSRARKDVADAFAFDAEGTKELLEDLKGRAIDGLELALESVPDDPSKRRRLKYVRENVIPLILRQLEEKGL